MTRFHGALRRSVLRPGTRGQEGAVSVLVAVLSLLLLSAVAMAVDIGSSALTSRDQQGAADLAALDGVRALGDLRSTTVGRQVRAEELVAATLAGNDGWAAGGRTAVTELGRVDDATGAFVLDPADPTAVRVTLTSPTRQFLPLPGLGTSGDVTRSAVAELSALAATSIGTSVVSIDSERAGVLNMLVGQMLGGTVALDAASWQGLADGTVGLRDLAAELGLGSPAELLDTDVTAGQLLAAAAAGLSSSGDPLDVAAATPLSSLAATAAAPLSFPVGDLLDLEAGQVGALADTEVDALSLVTAAASLVNGDNLLSVPLGAAVPGVASLDVRLAVIEPPRIAVGRPGVDPATGTWRTLASTAQVRVAVDLELDPLGTIAGVSVGSMNLPLAVDAGYGEAALTDVDCAPTEPLTSATNRVSTSAVRAAFGGIDAASLLAPELTSTRAPLVDLGLSVPLLGTVPLASVDATGTTDVAGSTSDVVQHGFFPTASRVPGSTSLGGPSGVGLSALLDDLSLDITLLGALPVGLDLVTDVLVPALDLAAPIVDGVDAQVVAPALESLGVSLGDADVRVLSVDCGLRRLVE